MIAGRGAWSEYLSTQHSRRTGIHSRRTGITEAAFELTALVAVCRTRGRRSTARPAQRPPLPVAPEPGDGGTPVGDAPLVELLVIPLCPHAEPARRLVEDVMAELGLDGFQVPVRTVGNQEDADRLGFVGSPTVLVGGLDPFAVPGAAPAVACRVYTTPAGLAGVPDRVALAAAISAHLARVR